MTEAKSSGYSMHKGFVNSSRQYLLGKLIDFEQRLELYRIRDGNEEHQKLLNLCDGYLKALREALPTPAWPWQHKTFTAWHLFHRLDETMILLMDRQELQAQCWEILQSLRTSPLSSTVKADWIAKIQEIDKKFGTADITATEVHSAAHLLRSAVYINNDQVDNLFWELWCKRFFGLIYTVLLIVLLYLLWHRVSSGTFSFSINNILLLGAIGGLGSGIMTAQTENIPYGHFWISTLYQTLVRPIQGSVAALMLFWMLQSQYLIAIDPPLTPCSATFNCVANVAVETTACAQFSQAATFRNHSGNIKRDPLVTLKAAPGMQGYLYLLVLLIAGFSGDKLLKFVSDKVTARLFSDAEKTKDGK